MQTYNEYRYKESQEDTRKSNPTPLQKDHPSQRGKVSFMNARVVQ